MKAQYNVLRPSQGDLQPWEAQKSSQAQLSSVPPSHFMALRFRLIIFSAEFLRMLGTDQQLDSPINSLRWEITWGHMEISSGGKLLCTIWKIFEVENYFTFLPFLWSHDFPPNSNNSYFISSHWQKIVVWDCYLHFPILSLQLWLWP